MNHIRQHIPAFARDDREPLPPLIPFSTLDELLEIPFVKRWKTENKDFSQYVRSDTLLMVELDRGFHWWVLGRCDEPVMDLPEWRARYMTKERGEIPYTDVRSICGGTITLRDGTKLTDSYRKY